MKLDGEAEHDPGETVARAAPMIQVQRMTLSTSMPFTRASEAFSATARMDFPSVVRDRNRCRPSTSTAVTPTTISSLAVMRMPQICSAGWMAKVKKCGSWPANITTTLRSISETPKEAMIRLMREALRTRIWR